MLHAAIGETAQHQILVLAEMGETDAAEAEIRALQERFPDLPPEEARYHEYFLQEVLGRGGEAVK